MKGLSIVLMFAFSAVFLSCRKDCKQTDYAFEGHFTASPDRETLRIDDTLWLELEMPTRLLNQVTNEEVDYSGAANLGTAINFGELKGGDILNPGGINAADAFDYVLKRGQWVQPLNPQQLREVLFAEEGGFYRLKLAIIPKRKGLFAISLGNAAGVYRHNNKCDKAGFNLTFTNTNQHLYLYEQSRPGYVLGNYEREHKYCFKVE